MTQEDKTGKPSEIGTDIWTLEQEDQLCKLWSEHTCLYDIKSKDFVNKRMRKFALAEIAVNLGRTGSYPRL